MKRAKLILQANGLHLERMRLMLSKGKDYADEDALSNFKRMNKLCAILGINPAQSTTDCALFLVILKLDRWQNLRRKGEVPQNESVRDTLIDLHNFLDLAFACEIDGGA